MVITHITKTAETKAGAEALAADLRQWIIRMRDVAQNDSFRQQTLKETRYYEGKAEAYRYFEEFIRKLAIEVGP